MRRKTKYPGVTQVGPRTYEIRTRVTDPNTGRRYGVRRTVESTTLDGAAAAMLAQRQELQSAPTLPPLPRRTEQLTLGVYVKSWLERRLARGMKPSTRARVAQVLEQVILPYFGSKPVAEIRKNDVESWLLEMSRRKNARGRLPAPITVNGWLRVAKTLLRDAVSDLELDHDPTARVKSLSGQPVRVTDEKPNSLTAEELRRFLDAAADESVEVYAMVVIGCFTGMRFGELSALTWNDVSEDDGLIYIRRSQWRGKVSTTKTGKTRSAPLHPIILDALKSQRKQLVDRGLPALGSSLVFPSATGGYHVPSYLNKPFRHILKAAKVEKHLSPHGMRRTYNNLMRQAQVDTVVLHATIGHSSDRMTEHYSHVTTQEKQAAVNRLFEVVVPDKKGPQLGPRPVGDDAPPSGGQP
jgi:integrase